MTDPAHVLPETLGSVDGVRAALEAERYICSRRIGVAVHLPAQLRKPILVQGPFGVGERERPWTPTPGGAAAHTRADHQDLPATRRACRDPSTAATH